MFNIIYKLGYFSVRDIRLIGRHTENSYFSQIYAL